MPLSPPDPPRSDTQLHASGDRGPDQAWFWTPEWQAKEREADEDFAAGRVLRAENVDEFIAQLEATNA